MPINPITYSGSVAHFRAWMDRYLATNGSVWTAVDQSVLREYQIEYSSSARTSTREVWHVTPIVPIIDGKRAANSSWATILAVEEFPNRTVVEFIDRLFYHRDTRAYTVSTDGREKHYVPGFGSLIEYAYGDPIGDDFIKLAEEIRSRWETKDSEVENEEAVPSSGDEREKIEAIEFSDSVEHLRARIERFIAVRGNKWVFPPSKEYHLYYEQRLQNSTREVWSVYSMAGRDSTGGELHADHAIILATEESNRTTSVEFLDGMKYQHPAAPPKRYTPIGEHFLDIAADIKSWLEKSKPQSEAFPQEPQTNRLVDWFDYLHAVKHRTRIKLAYIANKTGYAISTVKKEHSLYLKERGIQKVTKSNQK